MALQTPASRPSPYRSRQYKPGYSSSTKRRPIRRSLSMTTPRPKMAILTPGTPVLKQSAVSRRQPKTPRQEQGTVDMAELRAQITLLCEQELFDSAAVLCDIVLGQHRANGPRAKSEESAVDHCQFGDVLMKLGRFRQAASYYQQSLEFYLASHRRHRRSRSSRASPLTVSDTPNKSSQKHAPVDVAHENYVRMQLASALARDGKNRRAIELLQSVPKASRTPKASMLLASLLEKQGALPSDIEEAYMDVLRQNPLAVKASSALLQRGVPQITILSKLPRVPVLNPQGATTTRGTTSATLSTPQSTEPSRHTRSRSARLSSQSKTALFPFSPIPMPHTIEEEEVSGTVTPETRIVEQSTTPLRKAAKARRPAPSHRRTPSQNSSKAADSSTAITSLSWLIDYFHAQQALVERQHSTALACVNRLLDSCPHVLTFLVLKAKIQALVPESTGEALRTFASVRHQDTHCLEGMDMYASLLVDLDKGTDQLNRLAHDALLANPKSCEFHVIAALQRFQQAQEQPDQPSRDGSLNEAMTLIEAALKIDGNNVEALAAGGLIALHQDRSNRSLTLFCEAYKRDKGHVRALKGLVENYYKSKQAHAALAVVKKALKAMPRNSQTLLLLANLLSMNVRAYPKAIKVYRKVLEMDPASVEATVGIGRIRIAESKFKEAIDVLKSFSQDHVNHVVLTTLAKAFEASNDIPQALSSYETALCVRPNYGPAVNGLKALQDSLEEDEEEEPPEDEELMGFSDEEYELEDTPSYSPPSPEL